MSKLFNKLFNESSDRFRQLEIRADGLAASILATQFEALQHSNRVQLLEDILIKAGILVEAKDPPAVVSDIIIERSVPYTGPFRFFGPPTVLENKKYAVVVPVKKNSDTKTNNGGKK